MSSQAAPADNGAHRAQGVVLTHLGNAISVLDPDPAQFDLVDIAHGLAHTNRWNGALHDPLSVATHSMCLVRLVPSRWRLRALLHDASEAYLGDVVRGLKYLPGMAAYRAVEATWQERIYERYGIRGPSTHDPPGLLEADTALCLYEAELLGGPGFADGLYEANPDLAVAGMLPSRSQRKVVAPTLRRSHQVPPKVVARSWYREVTMAMATPGANW